MANRANIKKSRNGFGVQLIQKVSRVECLQNERRNKRAELFLNNRIYPKTARNVTKVNSDDNNTAMKENMAKCKEKLLDKSRGIINPSQQRIDLSKNLQEQRKKTRSQLFMDNRNRTSVAKGINKKGESVKNAKGSKTSSLDKRPPFVVGIVHYPLCPIPPLNVKPLKSSSKSQKQQCTSTTKISKVTQKRLAERGKIKNDNAHPVKKTPNSKSLLKTKVTPAKLQSNAEKEVEDKTDEAEKVSLLNSTFEKDTTKMDVEVDEGSKRQLRSSDKNKSNIKDENSLIKKRDSVNKTENSNKDMSKNRTSTPNSSVESVQLQLSNVSNESLVKSCEPALFSPYIVTSRGKENARKEQLSRQYFSFSSNDDDVPTKETIMQKLNMSAEEEEKTAQYFLYISNKEKERLNELCDKWEGEMEKAPVTVTERIGRILQETRSFLHKKMQRFLGLANDCKNSHGEQLVSCRDLQTFWEILSSSVQEFDVAFKYLDDLKLRNWQLTPEPQKSSKQFSEKKLLLLDKPPKLSEFNEFMIASDCTSTPKPIERSLSDKLNLLTLKVPEVELDKSISYVNSEQSPGKSILKKVEDGSAGNSEGRKSTQRVNFSDSVKENEIPDEEAERKKNLAEAIAIIDNYCSDEPSIEVKINRKLLFDESDSIKSAPRSIFVELMEAEGKISDSSKSNENDQIEYYQRHDHNHQVGIGHLDADDLISEDEDDEILVRSLRNRTINTSVRTSSVKKKRMKRTLSISCIENHSIASPHGHQKKKKNKLDNDLTHKHIDLLSRRRSKRKSVRFDEDTCTACTPQKRQLKPSTPRRKISKLNI